VPVGGLGECDPPGISGMEDHTQQSRRMVASGSPQTDVPRKVNEHLRCKECSEWRDCVQREKVTLPSGHEVTLIYFAKPPKAKQSAVWWLRLKKMGFPEGMHSDAYARGLSKLAESFALALMADAGICPISCCCRRRPPGSTNRTLTHFWQRIRTYLWRMECSRSRSSRFTFSSN